MRNGNNTSADQTDEMNACLTPGLCTANSKLAANMSMIFFSDLIQAMEYL